MNKLTFLNGHICLIGIVYSSWTVSEKDCWSGCGGTGGSCSSLCGGNGFCCQKNINSEQNGDCPIDGVSAMNELTSLNGHICLIGIR